MNSNHNGHTSTTVLVTGGCGYLGSQLIRDLPRALGPGTVTVRVLDSLRQGQHRALLDLPNLGHYQFIEGDILDPSALSLALQDVDLVIHLAAIVHTPMSFENPAWLEQVNHWGTAHLVEACLKEGVSDFVLASSTAVYGPGGPFSERDDCRPLGPYAQSKFHAEHVVRTALGRGLNGTILRFGTLYGYAPVLRMEAVANRFAYLAGIGRPLTVYGSGQQRRPLLHVQDASRAICHFAADLPGLSNLPEYTINVASGNISVHELVAAVQAVRPMISVRHTDQDIRTHLSFEVETTLAHSLGWRPQVDLASGVDGLLARFCNIQPLLVPSTELD